MQSNLELQKAGTLDFYYLPAELLGGTLLSFFSSAVSSPSALVYDTCNTHQAPIGDTLYLVLIICHCNIKGGMGFYAVYSRNLKYTFPAVKKGTRWNALGGAELSINIYLVLGST